MFCVARLVGKEEEYSRAQEQWAAARALLEQQLSKERADKVSLEAEVASRPTREEVVRPMARENIF